MYLIIKQSDILYAVRVVWHFMHPPKTEGLNVIHRFIKYLKGSWGQGILYSCHTHLNIEAYIGSRTVEYRSDRKSTTCCCIGGKLVSWKSKNNWFMRLLNFYGWRFYSEKRILQALVLWFYIVTIQLLFILHQGLVFNGRWNTSRFIVILFVGK